MLRLPAVVARLSFVCRAAFAAALAATAAACGGSTPSSPSAVASSAEPTAADGPNQDDPAGLQPPAPPAFTRTVTLSAVGDVGWCGSPGVARTAALLARFGGDILLLGDLAYPNGSADDFRRCFAPEYGRFKSRARPVPGNHEYETANAEPYFAYFGEAAGPGRLGYYAFRAGGWQVLMLNSSAPIDRGSAQYAWARDQLQQRSLCTAAALHHPFDSSGPHGPTQGLRDIWQILSDAGVELMVNGHDHDYERMAPQDADRRPVAEGLRQFTVGTGGAPLYARTRQAAASEVFVESWGVLRLTLAPTLYEWEFVDVSGLTLDRGGALCH